MTNIKGNDFGAPGREKFCEALAASTIVFVTSIVLPLLLYVFAVISENDWDESSFVGIKWSDSTVKFFKRVDGTQHSTFRRCSSRDLFDLLNPLLPESLSNQGQNTRSHI